MNFDFLEEGNSENAQTIGQTFPYRKIFVYNWCPVFYTNTHKYSCKDKVVWLKNMFQLPRQCFRSRKIKNVFLVKLTHQN